MNTPPFLRWSVLFQVISLVTLVLAGILSLLKSESVLGSTNVRYVAIDGSCGGATPCYGTPQSALDNAQSGDEIRIAQGIYTGIQGRAGVTQVLYISKTVTIRGGYSTTNWTDSYPITQPTTLDAQGQGRVIYITGEISPSLDGLNITGGNAAGQNGAEVWWADAGSGVYIITATATIMNNQVFSNTAVGSIEDVGGGVYLYNSPSIVISNSITSNTAKYGGGIGLYRSNAMLSNNSVVTNVAVAVGGGLYLRESVAILNENSIIDNAANTGAGLGLWDSAATLDGNVITENSAMDGGGAFLTSSHAMLFSNTFISNTAQNNGGGLYLTYSKATLVNNIVADNQANLAGGGIYIDSSRTTSPQLLHSTIARNGGGQGGGIYVGGIGSVVALTNTIIVSHTVGITVTVGNTATLEATLWGDGLWANKTTWGGAGTILTGTVNILKNPAFSAHGYRITISSAAINTGIDAGVATDIDGDIRPDGCFPDLGADEYITGVYCNRIYLPMITRS